LALDKAAREISVDEPASSAVDGDVDTYSCTLADAGTPWWAVDLGQNYDIGSVVITLPKVGGKERNYPLLIHLVIHYMDYAKKL